jgi:hypothetical protein
MNPTAPIQVFLSKSFQAHDRSVNERVQALCSGLGLNCKTVDYASPRTPAKEAQRLIEEREGLVAVAVRRDRVGNEYEMPPAVMQEIAMASARDKPILLFLEDGVRASGFIPTIGTYVRFKRSELNEPTRLETLVASIDAFRREIQARRVGPVDTFANTYYIDRMEAFFELRRAGQSFVWSQAVTKQLAFVAPLSTPLIARSWATSAARVRGNAPPMELRITDVSGTRKFVVATSVERATPTSVSAKLVVSPRPEKGDILRYTQTSASKWLSAIYRENVPAGSGVAVLARQYLAFDGVLVVKKTKSLKIHFRFPAAYGVNEGTVAVFAAYYTLGVNAVHDEETNRIVRRVTAYGGVLDVTLEVNDPIVNYFYGIAWDPPSRSRR